jgi:hypothetical protein
MEMFIVSNSLKLVIKNKKCLGSLVITSGQNQNIFYKHQGGKDLKIFL